MNGYVLDNEQILCLAESSRSQDVHDLIATIRDRDKMIAESHRAHLTDVKGYIALKQQNELMLSALERMYPLGHNNDCMFCGFKDKLAEDTITQVKALTVSKQEESAEDGDAN